MLERSNIFEISVVEPVALQMGSSQWSFCLNIKEQMASCRDLFASLRLRRGVILRAGAARLFVVFHPPGGCRDAAPT